MSKDFNKLILECIHEVKEAKIEPALVIQWEIDYRAKSRWGYCKRFDNYYLIKISARLLEDDRISEKACKETIIHEILHTCPNCMKHTGEWKQYARIMNDKYGYSIKRTTSGEEKGGENHVVKSQEYKYVVSCMYCHRAFLRKHKCKLTKYYRNYSCPYCGAKRAFMLREMT